jgi:hypothetical protein
MNKDISIKKTQSTPNLGKGVQNGEDNDICVVNKNISINRIKSTPSLRKGMQSGEDNDNCVVKFFSTLQKLKKEDWCLEPSFKRQPRLFKFMELIEKNNKDYEKSYTT